MMKARAAAVIIDRGRLLLIHRVKESGDYWVLPGGSVEPGESPEEACVRELKEETGLEIGIVRLITRFENRGRDEIYYLATRRSGSLRLGGPELARADAANRYEIDWVAMPDWPRLNLQPPEVRKVIAEQWTHANPPKAISRVS